MKLPATILGLATSRTRCGLICRLLLLFVAILACVYYFTPVCPRGTIRLTDEWRPDFSSDGQVVFGDQCHVAFSPDSKSLMTYIDRLSEYDCPLRVWDVDRKVERFSVSIKSSTVWPKRFSPDSTIVVAQVKDGGLKLWDAKTGEELTSFAPDPPKDNWVDYCLSPDGTFLVLQDYADMWPEKRIRIWNIHANHEEGCIDGSIKTVDCAPDSKMLATHRSESGNATRIMFWNIALGQRPTLAKECSVTGGHIAFSPDFTTIASAKGPDGRNGPTEIALWDASTGAKRLLFTYQKHDTISNEDMFITDLSFVANGRVLVTRGLGGSLSSLYWKNTLWELSPEPKEVASFFSDPIDSPDGEWIAVPDYAGVNLWNTDTMSECWHLTNPHDVGPYSLPHCKLIHRLRSRQIRQWLRWAGYSMCNGLLPPRNGCHAGSIYFKMTCTAQLSGCGTCGRARNSWVSRIVPVRLSPRMVRR